jgi:hypothetical protein
MKRLEEIIRLIMNAIVFILSILATRWLIGNEEHIAGKDGWFTFLFIGGFLIFLTILATLAVWDDSYRIFKRKQ